MSTIAAQNTLTKGHEEVLDFLKVLLKDELGVFSGGRPAIAVTPPKTPKVGTGLHVFMQRYRLSLQPSSSQSMQITRLCAWAITLRQYDESLEGILTLDRAADKVRRSFPNHSETPIPYIEGRQPQIDFRLNHTQTLNPLRSS